MKTNIIKYPYTYVPPCPCCGSLCTGRYIKQKLYAKDNSWVITESLKNGELVSLVPEIGENTTFCYDCEYTWKGRIQSVWLTKDEIFKEKINRGTLDILDALTEDNKEEKSIFTPIKKFLGTR